MSEWNLHSTKGQLNSKKGHFGINWHLGTPASEIRQFWLDLQVEFWSQGLNLNTIATSILVLNEKLWGTWPNRFVNNVL